MVFSSDFLRIIRSVLKESRRSLVPSIGEDDGLVLYTISYLYGSINENITAIDLGAGIGYSTIWIAKGIDDSYSSSGEVIAVERKKERAIKAKEILSKLPLKKTLIKVLNTDAIMFLRGLTSEGKRIDLAFVDIDKFLYLDVFLLLKKVMKENGVVLFHNAYFPSANKLITYLNEHNYNYTIVPTSEGIIMIIMK